MSVFSRREFLDRAAILAAVAAAPAVAGGAPRPEKIKSKGANDKLRVAVVGVNGRGMAHLGGFLGKNNVEVAAICDCDTGVTAKAMKLIEDKQGAKPAFFQDVRKLLEDPSIDAVSIATPNHWHVLAAVWAMRAGKDVYVEKPVSHELNEGFVLQQAAKKYDRICQVGTQSRSNPGMRQAIQYIHDGKIGKVELAYGTCYKRRKSIGKVAHATMPPKTMDYALWCGPAPVAPVERAHVHYDWHWIWAYGNGDFGNQGVHEADKARWGLNKNVLPNSVVTVGGRFGYDDDGQTPNTELALYDYGDAKMLFEVRGLETDAYKGSKVGNIWFGSEGYVVCPSYSSGTAFDRDGKKVASFNGGSDQHHYDNFVRAVRARDAKLLNCDAKQGHLSAALCHLANISYRVGEARPLAGDIPGFTGSAGEALDRMRAHLKANDVDLTKATGKVGPLLTVNPETGALTGTTEKLAEANALLTRDYRKGFDPNEAV